MVVYYIQLENKLFRMGGRVGGWVAGWVAGEAEKKAISAFNWVEVEVEAELGKNIYLLQQPGLNFQSLYTSTSRIVVSTFKILSFE